MKNKILFYSMHPMMTACGLSSLYRHKFKKVLGKMKGGSAHRKGAGMRPTVMPGPQLAVMPRERRTLQFR
jgi:hypothetical protein